MGAVTMSGITDIPDNELAQMSRAELLVLVEQSVASGQLTLGGATRILRKHIARLNQHEFAKLCGVSRRTLAAIEMDEGNPTVNSLNQVFKLFGLELGLQRIYRKG
ncbi:Predicted transcriptional regulators [hydrothermal vent metagenome]|jgi:DNA-binding XRE family transcriptional regulator|uniref:Predicted transcriptional regulators n=1 Tax=hydrothermal vent metagenome TaxID=652676 RepID=A0A160TC76_9ZZZZ